MKRTSLVSRLGGIVAALVIAQATLFIVMGFAAFRSQAYPARIRLVDNTALLLRLAVLPAPTEADLHRRIEEMSTVQGFAVALYDERGRRTYATNEMLDLDTTLSSEIIEQANQLDGRALLLRGRLPMENTVAVAKLPQGSFATFLGFAESKTPQQLGRGIVAAFVSQIVGIVIVTLLLTGWLTLRARRTLGEIENVVARMADGDLTIRLPIHRNDEVGRVAASFNRMADTLADRIAELRRIEAQRTRMFAAFTHEISTPLTSVLGYLESLKLPNIDEDPAKRRRYVEIAYTQSQALNALTEDLAMLSRLDFDGISLDRREIELNTWAAAELEPFRQRGQRRQISFHLDAPQSIFACVDPQRMGQVVRILLDNALRHTRDASTITLALVANDESIEIRVMDQGPGVAPEQLERLGEPLHRMDPSRSRDTGGRGLGLSIALGLVKTHGGTIHFASEVGSGLVVTVKLPRK